MTNKKVKIVANGQTLALAFVPANAAGISNSSVSKVADAWFKVNSATEAKEIEDTLNIVANNTGIINTTLSDLKTILSDGHRAYFVKGVGEGDKAFTDALSKLEEDATDRGIDIYSSKNVWLNIFVRGDGKTRESNKTALEKIDMDRLNDYIFRLGDNFNVRWGVTALPNIPKDEVRISLILRLD